MSAHQDPMAFPGGTPPNNNNDEFHLLLESRIEEPFFRSLFTSIKELIHPPKLPPLEVTSKPVPVRDIWGFYGGQKKKARLTSLVVHVTVVVLLFWLGTNKVVQQVVKEQINLIAPDIAPYRPTVKKDAMHGGGGGGDRSPTPVSKGKLPKLALRQFVPPMITHVKNPPLVMEPTLVMPPDTNVPKINAADLGDPLAKSGIASNGFGAGGGMGSGKYGGIGSGNGAGFGPGSGGGMGGGAYHIGGGVSQPQLLVKVEPEYSEEARKAKFQGSVILQIVVDAQGNPRDIKVIRPLGLGLDQKAIEAVQKWKFAPGKKDGKPVPVIAQIEVNFRLL